ncbi:unnamed protein product [Leuciscus chuanchicus]
MQPGERTPQETSVANANHRNCADRESNTLTLQRSEAHPETLVLTLGRIGQLESQRATSHLVFLSSVPPPERPAPVSRGPSPPSPVSQLTGSSVSRSGWRESGCDAYMLKEKCGTHNPSEWFLTGRPKTDRAAES